MKCPECHEEMYQQGIDRTPLTTIRIDSVTPETMILGITKDYICYNCDIKVEKKTYETYKQVI